MEKYLSLDDMVQPHRVHSKLYTEKEIFEQEMIKIFGGSWVYLAHESEIPKHNDFKTVLYGKTTCDRRT